MALALLNKYVALKGPEEARGMMRGDVVMVAEGVTEMKLMRLHPNAGRPGICERITEYICMAAARVIYRGMRIMARRMA